MNLLLEKFPIAKEKTEVIAKKCEEGDFSSLELKCYICRILGHVAAKCIKVKINPDHEDTKK